VAQNAPAAFFSYSRDDSDFALRLAGDLKAAGASVWLDRLDINPGQRWDRAVEDALNNCPRMLVILSPASVDSTNVMDEVSFALEEQKTVIPVIYKDCVVPFRLRRVQYVDFRQDYAHGLGALLKTLTPEQRAGQGTPASSEVRNQGQTDIPSGDERKHAAEQERLEAEHQKATKQTQIEEERKQPGEQGSDAGFLSKAPAWKKVAVAVCGILIIASIVYWVGPKSLPNPSLFTTRLGWAVGDHDILHTEDFGRTWQKQSSGTTQRLLFVTFITPQLGWTAGDHGTILHTEDGGGSWQQQSSGTTANLTSVTFVTPQLGWAVGEHGTILHTEDGGGTWQRQSSGTTDYLYSVTFATQQFGWVVVAGGIILHTEDAGHSWRKQSISGTASKITSVTFVNRR
jgi:hypothetical protein